MQRVSDPLAAAEHAAATAVTGAEALLCCILRQNTSRQASCCVCVRAAALQHKLRPAPQAQNKLQRGAHVGEGGGGLGLRNSTPVQHSLHSCNSTAEAVIVRMLSCRLQLQLDQTRKLVTRVSAEEDQLRCCAQHQKPARQTKAKALTGVRVEDLAGCAAQQSATAVSSRELRKMAPDGSSSNCHSWQRALASSNNPAALSGSPQSVPRWGWWTAHPTVREISAHQHKCCRLVHWSASGHAHLGGGGLGGGGGGLRPGQGSAKSHTDIPVGRTLERHAREHAPAQNAVDAARQASRKDSLLALHTHRREDLRTHTCAE